MTRGPWKYQKAEGHYHVLIGDEVLDVQNESDARLIALVPDMIAALKEIEQLKFPDYMRFVLAEITKMERK